MDYFPSLGYLGLGGAGLGGLSEAVARAAELGIDLGPAQPKPCAGEPKDGAQGPAPDPFAPEATIPLPFQIGDEFGYYGPTAIWKRNERERHRVRCVNEGYERLRTILPSPDSPKDRRLSKVETLRLAIRYLRHLEALLSDAEHYRLCECNLRGVFEGEEDPDRPTAPPPTKRPRNTHPRRKRK